VGSPPGGDPFAAPSAGGAADPFANAADPFGGSEDGPKSSAPAADDPFEPGQADPFAAAPPSDPFAALGIDVDEQYAPDFDAPDAGGAPAAEPPPTGPSPDGGDGVYGYQAETRVHEVDEELRKKAAGDGGKKKERGPGSALPAKLGGAVVRATWIVVQAALLLGFLTLAIVYARGGNLDDVLEGRAPDVVLGRIASASNGDAPVRAEEIAVARRSAGAENLVVVSGYVVNDGDADAPAVRVQVGFGDGASYVGWAGTEMSGLEVAAASTPEQLQRLLKRTPHDAAIPVGERRRFYVLAQNVEDGRKAEVSVEVAEPPPPPPPEPVAEPEEAVDDEGAAEPDKKKPRVRGGKKKTASARKQPAATGG
jgi:hypothetical protein